MPELGRVDGFDQDERASQRDDGSIRIGALYAIEKEIRGREPDMRREARREKSFTILADLEPWLREKLALISQKTKLAEAIRYALSRWEGLTRFVDDEP